MQSYTVLESRSYPQECIFNSLNGKQKKTKKKTEKKGEMCASFVKQVMQI